MLRVFEIADACLKRRQLELAAPVAVPESALWLDLYAPTAEETRAAEAFLGVTLPTKEEMEEIEASSRVYVEDDGLFMTTSIVSKTETEYPESASVTFVLAKNRLLTIRYSEPMPFNTFPARAERQSGMWSTADYLLVGILEAIVDRTADILERVGADVDSLSRESFDKPRHNQALEHKDFQQLLVRLGRQNDLIGKVRESLIGFSRILTFLTQTFEGRPGGKELRSYNKTITRDVASLADHTNFLSNKVTFLLDAILGMINLEQNRIIKILSVATTIFLPPTVMASIWGMNFVHMPELGWTWGYPMALGAIIVSAVIPAIFFKWRGWL
ncbi:MAG: magnesium/cobalt transporter CorA [Alphaproteobacteria bacterium]